MSLVERLERLSLVRVRQSALVEAIEPGMVPGHYTLPEGARVAVTMTPMREYASEDIPPGFYVTLSEPTTVVLYDVEESQKVREVLPTTIGLDFALTSNTLRPKREEFRNWWEVVYPGTSSPFNVYPGELSDMQVRANQRYMYEVQPHVFFGLLNPRLREPVSWEEKRLAQMENAIQLGERELARKFVAKYGSDEDRRKLHQVGTVLLSTRISADLEGLTGVASQAVANLRVMTKGVKDLVRTFSDARWESGQDEDSGPTNVYPQIRTPRSGWFSPRIRNSNIISVEGELTEFQSKRLEKFSSLPVEEQVRQANEENIDPTLADRMKGVAIRTVLGLGKAGDEYIEGFDITAWKSAESDTLFSSLRSTTDDFGVQVSFSIDETETVSIYANKNSLTAGLTETQSRELSQRIELFAKKELFDPDTSDYSLA